MIIEKKLYPSTKRIGSNEATVFITEKLDGSNIGFFRLGDELIIAQRRNILVWKPGDGLSEFKNMAYKGLVLFLEEHGLHLYNNLHDGSGFFGEWMGMGKINYDDHLDKKVYIFAKANIYKEDDSYNIKRLYYSRELFIYPFVDKTIPEYIGVVPLVKELNEKPNISELDELYSEYCEKVGRTVEGFVIDNNNNINKYVRHKNGKFTDHIIK